MKTECDCANSLKLSKSFFTHRNEIILVGLIFVLGFTLRIYGLSHEFLSSDHAEWIYASLNIFNNRHLLSNIPANNLIAGIYGFPYGFVGISSLYIFAMLLSLFNIPLTEITMSWPVAIFGSLTIIGVYLVGKEYGNKKIGVITALILAIEPFHVTQSRDAGRMHTISALCLVIFTIYFFTKYFITKQKKYAILSSSFLGLYLGSSNMAVGILPLLFYMGFIYCSDSNRTLKEKMRNTLSLLLRKEIVLIPTLLIVPYVVAQLYSIFYLKNIYAGFWGKTLGETKALGVFISDLTRYYVENSGYFLVLLFPIGAIYGLKRFFLFRKEGVIFFWMLIYTLPFIFLAPPYATVVRVYIMESEVSLMILSVIALYSLYSLQKEHLGFLEPLIFKTMILVMFLTTFIVTLSCVLNFNLDDPLSLGTQKNMSKFYGRDSGIKTAGYYIRENINSKENIFTDTELFESNYYFGRKIVYSSYDYFTVEEIVNYFRQVQSEIDVIVVTKENEKFLLYLLDKSHDKFFKNVEIMVNNEIRMVIYSHRSSSVVKLDASKYNRLFDYKYGRLKKLVPELAPWPQPDKPIPKAG